MYVELMQLNSLAQCDKAVANISAAEQEQNSAVLKPTLCCSPDGPLWIRDFMVLK
jgi:hypothetical protein